MSISWSASTHPPALCARTMIEACATGEITAVRDRLVALGVGEGPA